eukprot:1129606-Rhodomonas_salina.1
MARLKRGGKLSPAEIANEILFALCVGGRGLNSVLPAVLWCLEHHADILQRLSEEHGSSTPEPFALSDLLPTDELLDNFLLEVRRLHPTLQVLSGVTICMCTIEGMEIPKGSQVVASILALGRSASVYRSPEELLPSRWEGISTSERARFVPYGAGDIEDQGLHRCPAEDLV